MKRRVFWLLTVVLLGATGPHSTITHAQSLGAFRWQLQPFCNIVTLNVTRAGSVFTLDGFDDQCEAGPYASIVGTAFLNPDGSAGIGLTTVLAPGGTPVHVDARINLSTLSGPWRDSAGNSGTFVFTPGPGIGGPPRSVAPNGLPPGSITAQQMAPGAVGAAQINPTQVQARVGGTCPVGQYLRGIHLDGSVLCEPLLTPNVSTTVDDPANSVGLHPSIAIGADGLPIISHRDTTADALRVTHCGNAACTSGNFSTAVDVPVNSAESSTSLAIGADGLPIISHRDDATAALRVTHCGNFACNTADNVSTTVDDPANSVGHSSSIAIGADGLPIISHHDSTAGALRVTHCGNVACTAHNVSTTVDDPVGNVGSYTSIAIGVDGLPIISHAQGGTAINSALRVTHCGNAACTAGNVSTTVDAPSNYVGLYSSIAIGADGLPIISHHDITAHALRVTHCGNVACTAGNVSTTVDAPGTTSYLGLSSSIAIGADGLPIISHHESKAGSGALRVTHCGNVACTAGNVSTTVDDPGNFVGLYTSIAIGADGLPIVSHQDASADALRVTKCATRTCQ